MGSLMLNHKPTSESSLPAVHGRLPHTVEGTHANSDATSVRQSNTLGITQSLPAKDKGHQ